MFNLQREVDLSEEEEEGEGEDTTTEEAACRRDAGNDRGEPALSYR
jgi:hypothetical protein